MLKKQKEENAITLIALVITIIILLILAGISIATLTAENGILSKAILAEEETKKKQYEEMLKIIANGLRADKIRNNWDNKTYLNELEQNIEKEQIFLDSEVNRKNDETIIVITKEGWVYRITENEVKYIGKQGDIDIPTLEESNIKFEYDPSPLNESWTNEHVKVTILSQIDDYQLQYSTNEKDWSNYITPILINENGLIYARLVNDLYETVCYATGNITNIDKESPSGTISSTTIECSSITVLVTASDNGSQGGNASGITGYMYSIDGKNFTKLQNSNQYTFSNLKPSTLYSIVVKVIDKAGNSTDIEKDIKTKDAISIIRDGTLVSGTKYPTSNNPISSAPVPAGGYYKLCVGTSYTKCRLGGFEVRCPNGAYSIYLDLKIKKTGSTCSFDAKAPEVTCGVGTWSNTGWGEQTYPSSVSWYGSKIIPNDTAGKRVQYKFPVTVSGGLARIGFLTDWSWITDSNQFIEFDFYNLWLE